MHALCTPLASNSRAIARARIIEISSPEILAPFPLGWDSWRRVCDLTMGPNLSIHTCAHHLPTSSTSS